MNNNNRLPRPMGVTPLMIEYQKTANPEVLIKLRKILIHDWLLKGGSIFGKQLNIYELASLLNCEVEYIHQHMKEQMLNNRIFTPDNGNELINGLISQSIAWALEDRNEIQGQVDLLRKSQNGSYKPFISTEVTKALALKNTNSNSLLNIIRTMAGGNTVNIFNQNNNIDNRGVTVEKALELIREENSKQKVPIKDYEIIDTEYDIMDLPEVVATKQVGMQTEKEGLSIKKPELLQAADDYKGAMAESDETHHELRREIELMIDQDEVDPEIGPY